MSFLNPSTLDYCYIWLKTIFYSDCKNMFFSKKCRQFWSNTFPLYLNLTFRPLRYVSHLSSLSPVYCVFHKSILCKWVFLCPSFFFSECRPRHTFHGNTRVKELKLFYTECIFQSEVNLTCLNNSLSDWSKPVNLTCGEVAIQPERYILVLCAQVQLSKHWTKLTLNRIVLPISLTYLPWQAYSSNLLTHSYFILIIYT